MSGHLVKSTDWIATKDIQCMKTGTLSKMRIPANIVNADLNALFLMVEEVFKSICFDGYLPTVAELRTAVNQRQHPAEEVTAEFPTVEQLGEKYLRSIIVTPGRARHIKVALAFFNEFSEVSNVASIANDITPDDIYEFEKYIRKGRGVNRVAGILKIVRSFFAWCERTSNVERTPFASYKMPSEVYGRPISLTKIERDQLYALDIPEGMHTITYNGAEKHVGGEMLSRTRDLFVLQCHIGCRVNDYITLRQSNVSNGAIEYIANKTISKSGVSIRVPLTPTAKAIISKYAHQHDGRLMPFISAAKYNDNIKDLLCYAGMDRLVMRRNPTTGKSEQIELYRIASTHMARRTFINTLHKKVKNEVIASMTGHSKDSRAFGRYYDIDEETKAEAVNTILE